MQEVKPDLISLSETGLRPHHVEIAISVRAPKLSNVKPVQCLYRWPFGNIRLLKLGCIIGVRDNGFKVLYSVPCSNSDWSRYILLPANTFGNVWMHLFPTRYGLISKTVITTSLLSQNSSYDIKIFPGI